MALEIERKYLVNKEKWNALAKPKGTLIRQRYLLIEADKTIRVRIKDSKGYLTIKGRSVGATRLEYEYEIPQEDAAQLLNGFSVPEVKKVRYEILFNDKKWEVDEFLEDNIGLIIAEIELKEESEYFELPEWIGREVTVEKQYYNSHLTVMPFVKW